MADRVMTPWGYQSAVNPGGYNSKDVDYDAFYSGMYPQSTPVAGATPVAVPGTAYGSVLTGKDQATFAGDNPLQAQNPALNTAYANPGWGAQRPAPPVNLTVTGKGVPYNSPGWGAGTLSQLMAALGQQGADPGMGGLTGNMHMASGIPAQLPPSDGSVGLPKWASPPPPTTFAGSSTGRQYNIGQTYSSGGYLFQMTPNGPQQMGRDPMGVIPQSYQGTPQAAAAAAARERLTGGDGMDRSPAGSDFSGERGSDGTANFWAPNANGSGLPKTTWRSTGSLPPVPPTIPGTGGPAPRFRR